MALAVLNGAHGDLVAREAPALALGMTVRVDGRAGAARARRRWGGRYPEATGRLAVFLHGLTETEDSWGYRSERHHGDPAVTYGSRLRADLGLTPVYLRYNTGLHISDNGRALDALLDALVDAWPVPVQDVVLIGHSMGGLVARSALHQAGGGTAGAHGWTALVRDTVTLGLAAPGRPAGARRPPADRRSWPGCRRPGRWPRCSPCAASASRTSGAARWSRPTGPTAISTRRARPSTPTSRCTTAPGTSSSWRR